MEHIYSDDVNITGVYDEELQELHDNEEEEYEGDEYSDNVGINQTAVLAEKVNQTATMVLEEENAEE